MHVPYFLFIKCRRCLLKKFNGIYIYIHFFSSLLKWGVIDLTLDMHLFRLNICSHKLIEGDHRLMGNVICFELI